MNTSLVVNSTIIRPNKGCGPVRCKAGHLNCWRVHAKLLPNGIHAVEIVCSECGEIAHLVDGVIQRDGKFVEG